MKSRNASSRVQRSSTAPVGLLHISSASDRELDCAISEMRGYWKVTSMLLLRKLGRPVLDGLLVTAWSPIVLSAVRAFCESGGYEGVLLRHDRKDETGKYPMGGYIVPVEQVEGEVRRFFEDRRVVLLLEPASPYEDLYSVNVMYEPPSVVIEVIGAGFDASDLKRGDLSPHETFELPAPDRTGLVRDLSLSDFRPVHLINPSEYARSVELRLVKIGTQQYGQAAPDRLQAGPPPRKQELVAIAKAYLHQSGQTLLLDHSDRYTPIPLSYVRAAYWDTVELASALRQFDVPRAGFVVSLGHLLKRGLVYWDIVWPSVKYAGDLA